MKTRREFIATTIAATASLASGPGQAAAAESGAVPVADESGRKYPAQDGAPLGGPKMMDKAEDPRIRRARLAGPEVVTKDATVAEMAADGSLIIMAKGTNEWVCTPGNENKIGAPPMCMNPMGMQWMMDAMQGKPKPTNTAPGMIYMLCGATQRSNTDPADRTSPAIPIGPHWMITWPFNAPANGLPTTVRDRGAWVMFAGTPYEYLHVCGDPWDGNEYHAGDKAVWTMSYVHR
jgi:hypothetical protein